MNCVYIENGSVYNYPKGSDFYNPSRLYPEYPWRKDEISSTPNDVYGYAEEYTIWYGV